MFSIPPARIRWRAIDDPCRAAGALTRGARLHSHRFSLREAVSLRGKRFAAFKTPAGKNVATVLGLHALAEAVDHFALPLFGLESTVHRLHLFFSYICSRPYSREPHANSISL